MNSFREIDIDPEPETYLSRDFDLRKLMRRASAAITENDSTTLMDRFRAVLGDWFHGSHPTPRYIFRHWHKLDDQAPEQIMANLSPLSGLSNLHRFHSNWHGDSSSDRDFFFLSLSLHCRNGPFLKNIHEGGDSVESEVGHSKDLGSFLMSQVTVGHEIESEVRMRKDDSPTSLSISWLALTSSLRTTPGQYYPQTPGQYYPQSHFRSGDPPWPISLRIVH